MQHASSTAQYVQIKQKINVTNAFHDKTVCRHWIKTWVVHRTTRLKNIKLKVSKRCHYIFDYNLIKIVRLQQFLVHVIEMFSFSFLTHLMQLSYPWNFQTLKASQGKTFALNRWGGKVKQPFDHTSTACSNKCTENYCNRTILVHLSYSRRSSGVSLRHSGWLEKNGSYLALRSNSGLKPNLNKFFKWRRAFGLIFKISPEFGLICKIIIRSLRLNLI